MSISTLVGKTPLLKLRSRFENDPVSLYTKFEGNNPGGSVKDRAAMYMIQKALERGTLNPDQTLIEATSGNTGIALAMIAASFDINIKLVMPDSATAERIHTMRAYGAEVILTPGEKTIEYSRTYANELAKKNNYVILDQFNNPDNKLAHYETTGPEIWNDTDHKITHFVSSMGTTGTITGTSTFLKSKNKKIQIIGAQPKEGERIPGIRKWSKEALPGIFEADKVDAIRLVSRYDAIQSARELAKQEGLFVGLSSGGAFHIAKQIREEIDEGTIVFISCDRGDRYLSSDLIEQIN